MTKKLEGEKVNIWRIFQEEKDGITTCLTFQNNIQVEEFCNMIFEFKEVEDIKIERYDKLLLWTWI